MDEYITRNNAISAVCLGCNQQFSDEPCEPSDCTIRRSIMALPTADVVPRADVAREIFQEIYADLFRMLPLKVFHLISGDIVGDRFDAGKERALHDVIHCVAELEKKYTEEQTDGNQRKSN